MRKLFLILVLLCALSSWVQISESRHHHLFVHLPVTHAASCLTASFSAGGVTWTCNSAFLVDGTSPQSITVSPTAGTVTLIWAYICEDGGACTASPITVTLAIKDNINNPETCFQTSPGTPFTISDSGGFHEQGYFQVCPSTPSGITSFTGTTSSPVFEAIWLVNFTVSTGVPSSSTIDKDGLAVSSSSTTSGTVTLSANTVNANDLIIGIVDNDNDEPQTGFGSGFGKIVCDPNTNGCLQAAAVSATGSYTVCATWTVSPTNCTGGTGGTPDSWFAAAMGVKANAPSGSGGGGFGGKAGIGGKAGVGY